MLNLNQQLLTEIIEGESILSILRFLWRAIWMTLLLFAGLFSVSCLLPFMSTKARQWMVKHYSLVLVACCGVKAKVLGQPALDRPILFAANHVSWLDIFILNRVRATCFVAKSDIRHWPVIGWLVAGAGTVFIERGQRQAIKGVIQQMHQRFAQGGAVGFFPESTTSDGLSVRPFHASLFEAALSAELSVQPVALRFYHHGQRTARFAFIGEQSLIANLWVLLSSRDVSVECEFLPCISARECTEMGRAQCAERVHSLVKHAVEQSR